jgi:hypothetical protein
MPIEQQHQHQQQQSHYQFRTEGPVEQPLPVALCSADQYKKDQFDTQASDGYG